MNVLIKFDFDNQIKPNIMSTSIKIESQNVLQNVLPNEVYQLHRLMRSNLRKERRNTKCKDQATDKKPMRHKDALQTYIEILRKTT